MLFYARFITPILLLVLVFNTSATAQSWGNRPDTSGKGNHTAVYPASTTDNESLRAGVLYNATEKRWYLFFTVRPKDGADNPILTFTNTDGSSESYGLSLELIKIETVSANVNAVFYPIGHDVLEFLQSKASVLFTFGGDEYPVALTGSRAAISDTMAIVSDDAHTIAQAASDAEQARIRATKVTDECDRLAAHTWDQSATAPGVSWGDLDGRQAIAACELALLYEGTADDIKPRLFYQMGRGFDKTGNKRAFEYMQHAGWKMDYAAALYHLALLHDEGLYTPKNPAEAERAFRRASQLGHVPSKYRLGKLLLESALDETQRMEADILVQSSAIAGYPRALEYYGNLILAGKSTSTNHRLGVVYLTEASDKGQAKASYKVATMYRDGNVVSADQQQYMYYLKRAAQQGNEEAQKELEN